MLDFFRKYQWYFFLVITVVVIISFSFFGTNNALNSNSWREQIAFTAINGKEITRFDVDDMTSFLASDNEDKLLYGVWGFNFMNDGVITKDFLQTGMAQELATFYRADIQNDLKSKLAKEQKFKPYVHPQGKFISSENAWNYFIPELTSYYQTLKVAENPTDADVLNARVKLFLAEKQFPAPMLRQVLTYQEKQYNWLSHDSDLDRLDLSLFGYHHFEDWFGPRFTRIVTQFIINTAILAEQKGYEVSRAEVLADLIRNTELSFQQNKNNPELGVTTVEEYFNEQLRRLGMDQTRAIKVWHQVMLFRRYFHDVGQSALVDTLTYKHFNDYAKQSVNVDLYRLPAGLRLGDYAALQKFEVYLNAVSKKSKDDPLALPTTFMTAAEISKNYPELVEKRYLLEITQVSKKSLQARVGIKDTWNWELDDTNWAALKKQFPELAVKNDKTREERLAALDNLDKVTRSRVDTFARSAIVDAHPDWVIKALDEGKPQTKIVGLRNEGGKTPFEGLSTPKKRLELILLLDDAPIGQVPSDSSKLHSFTADQQNYYRIKVLEKDPEQEILTFAEANSDGTLDKVRDRILEKHYLSIREKSPAQYQKDDQSWKSFDAVRDLVADQYLEKQLKALEKTQNALAKENTSSNDQKASLRFYSYLQKAKEKLEKDPSQAEKLAQAKQENKPTDKLVQSQPLANQWLLEKEIFPVGRGKQEAVVDVTEAFALPQQAWSAIRTPSNGDLVFYQVRDQSDADNSLAMAEQTNKAHALLSAETQRVLMRHLLNQIQEKGAISLKYMDTPREEQSQGVEPNLVPEF